jgi:hypothetical protein
LRAPSTSGPTHLDRFVSLGVIALNAPQPVHREVKVWALLSRSALAIAAGLPRPGRR